ncbi:CoA-binding protein [Halobacteriales archaeon QH_10_70_21]|jgi:predicted CoA-binding protein|nr:MAG: CoA-binding protein [Halobacteriales archaeon QH_10_70_21]
MPVESDDELREILELETIAVVGCSSTPGKAAHDVPKFMRQRGYDIVPVNPYADEIFGKDVYDSLAAVEETVELVDVFRPSEEVAGIVDEALGREDVEAVWTQLGIRDPAAGERVEAAGKRYVEDRCLKVEYQRLL